MAVLFLVLGASLAMAFCFLLDHPPSGEDPPSASNATAPAQAHSAGPASGSPTGIRQSVVVQVESEPSGAGIFLNGRLVGATPFSWRDVRPGAYGLRLEKSGHEPKSLVVQIDTVPLVIRERLAPLKTGILEVDIKPRGAEVFLDGEFAGLTPLRLTQVQVGQHELLISKTNYDPYPARIEIQADKPMVYQGFELRDKILAMLNNQIRNEPKRLSHYIDLGHYLFVNEKIDEAVEAFLRAEELAEEPLVFPEEMAAEERAVERRLRTEDAARLKKEIAKHKRWQGKTAQQFREKLERAEELNGSRNLDSWTWVEMAARNHIQNGKYQLAETLFLGHLKAAPNSPNVFACLLELLKVRLKLRNVSLAHETFVELYEKAENRPDLLLDIGSAIAEQRDRVQLEERPELLAMAEKAFRQAIKHSKLDLISSQCRAELGLVFLASGRPVEAAEQLKEAMEKAPSNELRENRALNYAEALRLAKRPAEAKKVVEDLVGSERELIRRRAQTMLEMLKIESGRTPAKNNGPDR